MKHPSRLALRLLSLAILLLLPGEILATELHARYVTLEYTDTAQLKSFNKKLKPSSFSFSFSKSSSPDLAGEVRKKLNQLSGQVQEILEMKPNNLKFRVSLLANRAEVKKIYQEQFNRKVDFVAFYSPKTKTVYFSIKDLRLKVFVHEVAHAVIDHYFDKAPPTKIHEMLAQYVETKI